MKELVKYHSINPIKVNLPSNKINSIIDVFVVSCLEEKNNHRQYDYIMKLNIVGCDNFKYLTNKIIKHYVFKSLRTQFKLFSIDENNVGYEIHFN